MQIEDVRIAKEELGLTAIRTSHYPQSHDFIEACDRMGLLVFTEFPGWQHLGDKEWKDQVIVNLKEMIREYRNHPSIILWGVRINESLDDDELYEELRKLRRQIANEMSVPAFVVMNDKVLSLISARKPKTVEEFGAIPGIGTYKRDRYAELFLAVIAKFTQ